MPGYASPGVYVEEVPSSIKPIAGVSTSTAAFVGVVPETINMVDENPNFDPNQTAGPDNPAFLPWTFPLPDDSSLTKAKDDVAQAKDALSALKAAAVTNNKDVDPKAFRAAAAKLNGAQSALARINAHLSAGSLAPAGHPVYCTTFGDFTRSFGGFSLSGLPAADAAPDAPAVPGQNQLAHGVFGFFNNGGTSCYVMRYANIRELRDPTSLAPFEAIDEISLVLAPGITDPEVQTNIVDHCTSMSDRFAILDAPQTPADLTPESVKVAHNSDYAAVYFPWVKVFDAATQTLKPDGDGEIFVGPSGHMAGIYARVDHERGVHKAPANEVVRGAMDLGYQITRNVQDNLNPVGVNCIRNINGNFTVWGARTIGGDSNADLKYINVRRTLLFLRKSIDHGTQWVVFEPNDRTLWAKIVRNVSAFLTTVWRDGALFGSTPAEAFYVRCDDETNPPENRDLGRVTTEIGVAIVRPAEFVIFRIEQWGGPQGT